MFSWDMRRTDLWRWIVLALLLGWSVHEIYPPTSRSLLGQFESQAVRKDTNFTAIVQRALELQKEFPDRTYGNLVRAIGTNNIMRYFPSIPVAGTGEPTRIILNRLQQEAEGKIKLGLDLRGGTMFLVTMSTNRLAGAAAPQSSQQALAQAIEVLRRRVDALGVAEPLLEPVGSDQILIEMPGLSEAETASARRQIEKAAFLEFRMILPNSAEYLAHHITVPGYQPLELKPQPGRTNQAAQTYLVKIQPEDGLTGQYVKSAQVVRDPVTGQPEIAFTFDAEGARKFAHITEEYAPQNGEYHQLGIVLDGELYSAPVIKEPIRNGRGEITGSFTTEEAFELANVLENPLAAPVTITEERQVDPSLGKDSIRSGITACAVGAAAVITFMLVYYLYAGLVADIALLFNILMLFGVMSYIGTTLTIPGIAGIVLTIGMSVDANVLIFERIREERAAAKSLRGALAAGYKKAFGTIFDSHVTTLIASVILIYLGTGPVKGFGVTLTIGVALSLFTAWFITRLIFDWLLEKGWLKSLRMLHLIHDTHIDFMRWAKYAFVASWTLILIGCGYGAYRGSNVLGVDFAGGDSLTLGFSQRVGVDELRKAVQKAVGGESLIQYAKNLSTGKETLRLTVPFKTGAEVAAALERDFPQARFKELALDRVGPSVGKQIEWTAVKASALSMLGILVYLSVRYEFSFSVGAVLAIIHDILMTLGCFFLSGRQLSAPIVAAVLTIIGFSTNDTVVIFDRIREDLRLGVSGTFKEVMNHALNRTLSRTLITSGTVFLATLSLYLFGGGVINDFAFTFLVGILTGTYSSIYIASALVLWWHKGKRPQIGPVGAGSAGSPGIQGRSSPAG